MVSLENKIFRLSLTISFLMHLIVFAVLFFTRFPHVKNTPNSMEVVYRTHFKEVFKQDGARENLSAIKKDKNVLNPKILDKESSPPTELLKDAMAKKPVPLDIHKKEPMKLPSLEGKRQITVPLLQAEKIRNPKYVSYHEIIRNKIKNRAYFYVDDPSFQEGEVYLTFVILSNGELEGVHIIDSKTNANDFLRSVGIRSIKESSPFPSFPADLKYPELSFNVIISFKIDEK